ncbi:MAG: methyltransferase domain-containing protein [Bacteroidetes bacterium]|nr:methyltransferase domain-containing protein [Bacteroidota bacterium]
MIKKITNMLLAKAGYAINKLPSDHTNTDDFNRLPALAQKLDVVKLHFGCGPRILKGWLNFDLAYEPFEAYLQYYTDTHYPPEIRGSRNDLFIINILKDGIPLPDNSVDLIFHEDFFEHLTEKQQVIFLAETFRVMKKGAIHRINTPNLRASMRDNSDFSKGKAGVFNGEWDYWHHFNVISPAILKELADIVGYSQVQFNAKNKSTAADQLPLEYRPNEKDRQAADGNVFADLVK